MVCLFVCLIFNNRIYCILPGLKEVTEHVEETPKMPLTAGVLQSHTVLVPLGTIWQVT